MTDERENKPSEEPPPPYPGPPPQNYPSQGPGTYPTQGTYPPQYPGYPAPPPERSYPFPPPGYNYPGGKAEGYTEPARGYTAPAVVVTTQPVSSEPVFSTRGSQPSSYLALSIVTCLCFSPLCGLIAVCFSVMSQNAYLVGDTEGAKRNGKMALALSVAGIVLSVVVLIILFSNGRPQVTTWA